MLALSGSSDGIAAKVSSSPSSILALKYARLTSMKLDGVLLG